MLLRCYFLICGYVTPNLHIWFAGFFYKSFIMTNSKMAQAQSLEFDYTNAAGTQIQNISQKKWLLLELT